MSECHRLRYQRLSSVAEDGSTFNCLSQSSEMNESEMNVNVHVMVVVSFFDIVLNTIM